jgi:transcriptional regulator with XRE-family HTH domain
MSQLGLATEVETTTRHLSYVENGRSRPGRDLVLRLAAALDLPLRARNDLLVAAGLPSEFPANALESVPLAPYVRAISGVITALNPFPAFVIDTLFNLEQANETARRLLPARALGRENLLDAFLAPGPTRELLTNFSEIAWSLAARFARATAAMRASPELAALRQRIDGYLEDVPRPPSDATGELVVCPTFRIGNQLVHTVGMTLRFGPSRDVTLEELSVDVLYPRDEAADRFFRELAAGN